MTAAATTSGGVRAVVAWAAAADVVAVLVFVAVGRRTHSEGGALLGTLGVAWPFLVGLAAGWVIARAWRTPTRPFPTGVLVWAAALVLGLGLRGLTGGGLAPAFVAVAAGVLALLLIGWRAVATALVARRRPAGGADRP